MSFLRRGPDQAINHSVPKEDDWLSRVCHDLGILASHPLFLPERRRHGGGEAEVQSFLDADEPPRSELDRTLDALDAEADARLDEMRGMAPQETVILSIPEASRPIDPRLN